MPAISPLVISGDETQLAVAIGAVIKNSIEAVGANGHVSVSLQRTDARNGVVGGSDRARRRAGHFGGGTPSHL